VVDNQAKTSLLNILEKQQS